MTHSKSILFAAALFLLSIDTYASSPISNELETERFIVRVETGMRFSHGSRADESAFRKLHATMFKKELEVYRARIETVLVNLTDQFGEALPLATGGPREPVFRDGYGWWPREPKGHEFCAYQFSFRVQSNLTIVSVLIPVRRPLTTQVHCVLEDAVAKAVLPEDDYAAFTKVRRKGGKK